MMRLFLKFELQKTVKYFKTKTSAKLITSLLFLIVFVTIGVFIYYALVSGFRYINIVVDEDIRLPLTLFLYELFLIILALLIIFSSMVSGVFNLFKGQYDRWILSSPGYKVFPKHIFIKSLISSTWPLFVMFLPAVLAINKVYTLGILGLFLILLSVILFLIILNAISFLTIAVVGYIYYKISTLTKSLRFTFGGMISALIFLFAGTAAVLWNIITNINIVNLFKAQDIGASVSIPEIAQHFKFLPVHPFAMEIIDLQSGQLGSGATHVLVLFVLAFLLVLIWSLASSFFYPLWQKFQEGNSKVDTKESASGKTSTMTYRFLGGNTMALFKKEALISSRNLKGVLWFFFLFFIWMAQIGVSLLSNHSLANNQSDIPRVAALEALQFIITLYFICAFSLRFVFPSFSAEKKTAWILGSAPLGFKKIFFGKYLFYTSFFVLLGVMMSAITSSILTMSSVYSLYSMMLFIVVIIGIVTLALFLGAVFPNTETDDPEVITTSMPGLFFTGITLIYGAISAGTLYLALTQGILTPLVSVVIATVFLVIVTLFTVPRWAKHSL